MQICLGRGRVYTGDTPMQSVVRFELHYKSKSGIIFFISRDKDTTHHRPVSMASLWFKVQ